MSLATNDFHPAHTKPSASPPAPEKRSTNIPGRPIAFVRDEAHWEFLRVRSEAYFLRVSDRQIRQRVHVATSDGRFVGYLVTVEGRGEWNVREVGALDSDPGTMARILRAGAWESSASAGAPANRLTVC